MKKYNILGHEMVMMDDVKWAIRRARKNIDLIYNDKSEEAKELALTIINNAVRLMYFDEIREANTKDEIADIIEMTGDFIITKREDGKIFYFAAWVDKSPVCSASSQDALHFNYEGMAEITAEKLKAITSESWVVVDNCKAELEYIHAFFDAIYGMEERKEEH